MKEVSYIHTEGYSASALKHGTFALLHDGCPIIILDLQEEHRDKNRNAFQEVLARGALVIQITDSEPFGNPANENEFVYKVDTNHTFGGLIANCCIQFLSYTIAKLQDRNPDFPRNLAKVVTVE
jgi:glucosamine--fructose-6-phosphate aminotransferase (isomerizing)